jgi:hypothetical protein
MEIVGSCFCFGAVCGSIIFALAQLLHAACAGGMGQYLSLSFFDVYVGDNLKFVWAELSI